MNIKQEKLETIRHTYDQYERTIQTAELLRKQLANEAKEARLFKATQQEIADQTKLSRQRIQQLLAEENV